MFPSSTPVTSTQRTSCPLLQRVSHNTYRGDALGEYFAGIDVGTSDGGFAVARCSRIIAPSLVVVVVVHGVSVSN